MKKILGTMILVLNVSVAQASVSTRCDHVDGGGLQFNGETQTATSSSWETNYEETGPRKILSVKSEWKQDDEGSFKMVTYALSGNLLPARGSNKIWLIIYRGKKTLGKALYMSKDGSLFEENALSCREL